MKQEEGTQGQLGPHHSFLPLLGAACSGLTTSQQQPLTSPGRGFAAPSPYAETRGSSSDSQRVFSRQEEDRWPIAAEKGICPKNVSLDKARPRSPICPQLLSLQGHNLAPPWGCFRAWWLTSQQLTLFIQEVSLGFGLKPLASALQSLV